MRINITVAMLLVSGMVHADLHKKTIEYKQGQTTLEGYVAYDDAIPGVRPGIIVIHDWLGVSDFTRERANTLAKMGYIAFAADIYGKGIRPKNPTDAMAQVVLYKGNRALLRARAQAALDTLLAQPQTDPKRIVAMGYCFGGTAALELARAGAPLAGVVTFHGGLDTPTPQDAKNIKGKVLVLAGGDDPHVPPDQVQAFEKEMRDAKVDWQLISYGGAVHAFAVPSAGNDNTTGAAYNATADHRSWQAMKDFLAEIFPGR